MDGRVHMRAAMHDAFELLHQQAVLSVQLDDAHVELRTRRPLRHAMAPAMGKIVDLKVFRARGHFCLPLILSLRHARLYAGHPRLSCCSKTWMAGTLARSRASSTRYARP